MDPARTEGIFEAYNPAADAYKVATPTMSHAEITEQFPIASVPRGKEAQHG